VIPLQVGVRTAHPKQALETAVFDGARSMHAPPEIDDRLVNRRRCEQVELVDALLALEVARNVAGLTAQRHCVLCAGGTRDACALLVDEVTHASDPRPCP